MFVQSICLLFFLVYAADCQHGIESLDRTMTGLVEQRLVTEEVCRCLGII